MCLYVSLWFFPLSIEYYIWIYSVKIVLTFLRALIYIDCSLIKTIYYPYLCQYWILSFIKWLQLWQMKNNFALFSCTFSSISKINIFFFHVYGSFILHVIGNCLSKLSVHCFMKEVVFSVFSPYYKSCLFFFKKLIYF